MDDDDLVIPPKRELPIRRCDYVKGEVKCISPAIWRPVLLLVPTRGYTGRPFPMALVNKAACEEHKTRMPDWLLSDDLWKEVLMAWAALTVDKPKMQDPPHRLSTRVAWQELTLVTPNDVENLPLDG
jgi:hypothetical protein